MENLTPATILLLIVIIIAMIIMIILGAKVLFGTGPSIGRIRCKKCGGVFHRSGSISWSGGMPNGKDLIEKFYKCDGCDRTISDQWD